MSTSLTPPTSTRPRVSTIGWGVVLLIAAALLLAGQFFTVSVDPVILTLALLVGVGSSLLAGGILSLRSRRAVDADPLDPDPLAADALAVDPLAADDDRPGIHR